MRYRTKNGHIQELKFISLRQIYSLRKIIAKKNKNGSLDLI